MHGLKPARNHANLNDALASDGRSASRGYPGSVQYLQVLPDWTPPRPHRRASLIVRLNRALRTALVTFCGLALLGYGLDVASSAEVQKMQEQARRLSEQNTELSAQLLRAISFQDIQANVAGHLGLRVPEHVVIVPEIQPMPLNQFKPNRNNLPLLAGY